MTTLPRPVFAHEHEDFRRLVRGFLAKEVAPHHAQWELDGIVPREVWRKAGALGLLCFDVDEAYGGPGVKDFRFNAVLDEELVRGGFTGPGFPVHTDITVPYLNSWRITSRRAAGCLGASPGTSSRLSP